MIKVNIKKLLSLIAVIIVLTGVFCFPINVSAAPLSGAVNIMPLGDSITVGYPGVEGYRKNLYLDLINSGYNVNFVGSQKKRHKL